MVDELKRMRDAENLVGLGEETQLPEQAFSEDRFYRTAIYPAEASEGRDRSAALLLALEEQRLGARWLAEGEREALEQRVDGLDRLQAQEGVDRRMEAAQTVAEWSAGPAGPAAEEGLVQHVDGGGTLHWFAVVGREEADGDPYELRYFRALELDDGTQRGDSYAVMPLADDDPGSAWPLRGLEMYLERGDVYMAQQLAHDVADAYGQSFPDPLELPALNPAPEYYFGYGVGPSNAPSLEAVKTWMAGAERRFDTLTLGEYGSFDEAAVDERELESLVDERGTEAAMNLAERMAVAGGYLDEQRDDARIFFEEDAPSDPFTTLRARGLAGPQYSVGAISANGEHFLDVMKTWGVDEYERWVIPQASWEAAQLQAERAFTLQAGGDLQGAMQLVEQAGVDAGIIDPEREDLRLFTQGPPDPFETLAQRLSAEVNPDLNTPAAEEAHPYWRLDALAVHTPEGAALGYALHCTVFPELAMEEVPEEMDDPRYPATVRRLEVAHFATREAAQAFTAEFRGYLIPGLLEGPELAQEVARLEGHPVAWETLDMQGISWMMSGGEVLTRDPAAWRPYNPHAERDARIEAEGLYSDPIRQFVKLDEGADEPKVEPVSPDFDL